jgi:predicted TIM-barrel fold metal-dependent hydrolase
MADAPEPEPEARSAPKGLPPIVDAHVHVFPDRLFAAVQRWFDEHGWRIRYRMSALDVVRFLLDRGVERVVALQYAHKPGMARDLNRFMAELCEAEPGVTGLATVFPGEPDAAAILHEAFDAGLAGIKLHCHVQGVAPDDPVLDEIWDACTAADRVALIHSGREPRSAAYPVDTHLICGAGRVEAVLRAHPRLRLCVPHLGADECEAHLRLLERYDNLWLDTTMMLAGYFPIPPPPGLFEARPDRILYGSDFPNIPYEWDRELRWLADAGLSDEDLAGVLGRNALELYRPSTNRAT